MAKSRYFFWGAVILFTGLVIAQPIHIHTYGRTIIDDGYYYLGYARSIATGQGATFDGLIETNGVQPLWALVLTLFAFVSSDREVLLYLSLVVAAAFALGSVYNINRILRTAINDSARWIMLILYTAFVMNPQLSLTGMETSLNLFVLTFTLALIWKLPPSPRPAHLLMVGLWIGLVCLARIDNLIITPLLALLALCRTGLYTQRRIAAGIRMTIMLALPALFIFGVYLVFNQMMFDRWLPISGEVKSAWLEAVLAEEGGRFSTQYLRQTTAGAFQHYLLIANNYLLLVLATYSDVTLLVRLGIVLVLAAFVLLLALRILRRRAVIRLPAVSIRWMDVLLGSLLLSGLFLHTWIIFFQLGPVHATSLNWYYAPEYIALTLILAYVLDAVIRWQPLSQRAFQGIVFGLIILMVIGTSTYMLALWQKPLVRPLNTIYEMALWSNDNLPESAIGGAFNAGVMGYFTNMRIINLDGLMNNAEVLQVARQERTIWSYVQSQPIDYIMDYQGVGWSEQSGAFRGIPTARLQLLHQQDFMDWGRKPSTYYVFRLLPG